MENLYKEMFEAPRMLTEQVRSHLFNLSESDGPTLVVVDTERRFRASRPGCVGFLLSDDQRLLKGICQRLDDGEDPLITPVKGGCVAACQLATERAHCGYLLIFLEGYTPQTIQANMQLVEMIFAQAELICELVEKNNQLHQLRLVHLSRTSPVLV